LKTALVYATIAAGANVLGAAAVTARPRWSAAALDRLLAFSAGFMIAVALLELIPEAFERDGRYAAAVVLIGYLAVHLTQHALVAHFHFGEETHKVTKAIGWSALAGLMLHTLVDGVAISSGFSVSAAVGLLVFLAIMLHKIPEGLAISSIFLAAGASRGRALLAAGVLGLATIVGVMLTEIIEPLAANGLALSGGVALYVGASNLVPEFQAKKGWQLPFAFFLGCGLYAVLRYFLRGV
jgi:zinc and cadmium transporter